MKTSTQLGLSLPYLVLLLVACLGIVGLVSLQVHP